MIGAREQQAGMRYMLLAAASAAILAAAPATAQRVHQYGGLALSPRGDRIATLEGATGDHAAVTIRAAAGGRILTTVDPCKTCSYSGLTFAPDGALAFLARDRTAGTVSLDWWSGSATRTLVTIRGLAQTPRVSPDGKRIALLVTLDAAKEAGATQAGARQIGEIGEKNDEQRLAVVDIAAPARTLVPVSPAGRYVYEYDWTPDSRGFVATTALGNGDNNWWVATLDAIDAATGAGASDREAGDADQRPARVRRRQDGELYRRPDERFRLGRR